VSDDRYHYGKPVVDGVVNYTSPSQLDKADPRAYAGCLRRWFYRYVLGMVEPTFAAQAVGIEGHGQIAHYLTTGEDVLGTAASAGRDKIPTPGDDLIVEWAVAPPPPGTPPPGSHAWDCDAATARCARCGELRATHALAPCAGKVLVDPRSSHLWIEGVPVVGYLDLAHARGTNQGGNDILDTHDPHGTIEVLDWKFTGNMSYAKSHDEVGRATPMLAYAEGIAHALHRFGLPRPEHARLSHVYFATRGRESAKRSRRLPMDEVSRRWESVGPVMRSIVDAARETNPDNVTPNLRACGAFGKGCPHRQYCTAGMHNSLRRLGLTDEDIAAQATGDSTMGIMDELKKAQASAPAAPPMTMPAGVTPIMPPAGVGVTMALAPQPPPVSPEFVAACAAIDASPYGWPPVTGEAARLKAIVKGIPHQPGAAYAGSGTLGGVQPVGDPAQIIAIAAEISEAIAAQAKAAALAPQPPAGIPATLPPDAPASNPAIAALPVTPTAAEMTAGVPWAQPAQVAPAQIGTNAGPAVNVAPAAPVAEKPKRERKARTKGDAPAAPTAASTEIEVFVDCVPGVEFENLATHADAWCKVLTDHCKEDDVRSAQHDGLAFGKWKGALAAVVRSTLAQKLLEPGTYFLDARTSEIRQTVAEALEGCPGVVVHRGIR
jgi:hypothetical protein